MNLVEKWGGIGGGQKGETIKIPIAEHSTGAHQHVRILFGCYKREWWRWDRTMQNSYDKRSINRAQGNRKLWFQLHKSMYILHMDYLIKTGEWQKLQQLRWHGDTMDGLFPKFSLTLIFWQLLGNKYKVKKKKITILALFLLAYNNPFSAGIFSNYYPVLPAPCNTY